MNFEDYRTNENCYDVAWYLNHLGFDVQETKQWRRRLCTADNPGDVQAGLKAVFDERERRRVPA